MCYSKVSIIRALLIRGFAIIRVSRTFLTTFDSLFTIFCIKSRVNSRIRVNSRFAGKIYRFLLPFGPYFALIRAAGSAIIRVLMKRSQYEFFLIYLCFLTNLVVLDCANEYYWGYSLTIVSTSKHSIFSLLFEIYKNASKQ